MVLSFRSVTLTLVARRQTPAAAGSARSPGEVHHRIVATEDAARGSAKWGVSRWSHRTDRTWNAPAFRRAEIRDRAPLWEDADGRQAAGGRGYATKREAG
jgi:hypothetical protein